MRRPRAMVLDEVWHRLAGVEALSGPHGGPLRRTVKLILDPLVIRPVQQPLCAGPIISAEGAVELTARLLGAAEVLRATAAWFTLLKQIRRSLRITEGNPQDLYFQRCFELATTTGAPDPTRGPEIAEATLREVHETSAGRTTHALKEYLTAPDRVTESTRLLESAWRQRPSPEVAATDYTARLTALADAVVTAWSSGRAGREQALLDELVDANAGTEVGTGLWSADNLPTARYLGLTAQPEPPRPRPGAAASTATLALPFDRSIYERVFTVLHSATDRTELPTVPELVAAEIGRSCAPWALCDESLRVVAATGTALALGLRPLGADPASGTGAQQAINARWRREAYVLAARRLAIRTDDEPTGPLAMIAAELRVPWQPYLRRLWVRLHGRDARNSAMPYADELWDLLDGVARSVALDHRMRVKQALSVDLLAAEIDSMESRAG